MNFYISHFQYAEKRSTIELIVLLIFFGFVGKITMEGESSSHEGISLS